jgi:hypothetical protein
MAGLADVVAGAVATAKSVTDTLQDEVFHESWDGTMDQYGNPTLLAPVTRKAVVEKKQSLKRDMNGVEHMTESKVTFLQPTPITQNDRITMSDGTRGSIMAFEGLFNPDTDAPYLVEVWLG